MASRDAASFKTIKQCIDAKAYTADENGATVDTKDHEAVTGVVNLGISGDTLSGSVYLDVELEHSDDGSAWSDCADSDIVWPKSSFASGKPSDVAAVAGTVFRVDDPAEDETSKHFGYIGKKRYVRAVLNLTGTHTNGIEVSVDFILETSRVTA